MSDDWSNRLGVLGATIRRQRQLAQMSLRQLAELAQVSNPYLSQIERGLHEPSVRVVRSIAKALNVSAEELLGDAGMLDDDAASEPVSSSTEDAIQADAALTDEQKDSLVSVYRAYRAANGAV
ncbi:MAG: transcriptional regulator [Acidimicrobiales bacterium mtb01]|nr:helix-turn-helix transcriptional regulator [Actinomycetota bacterium]TEX46610.1 MAG: transcriptional regulator [Acidimicrobiales bacterium mtb01]